MLEEEIEALKSEKGGWTKKTLESLGVPWPPPKGWKQALIDGEPIPERQSSEWTKEAMETAELIHGPDSMNSDTYRLWDIEGGKMFDVPGWMVGDPEGAELKMYAAAVIRKRLAS